MIHDLARVLRHAGRPERVDWVGTSMGGLIGMMMAAKPGSPIGRLVLNDIGPLVPWSGLVRLKNVHSGLNAKFKDLPEVERHLRDACAPFGPLDDAQWRHVTRHSARKNDDGTWSLAYDPGIISALRRGNNSGLEFGGDFLLGVDLWPVWETIKCPTLVLRGTESDLLLEATAQQMAAARAEGAGGRVPGHRPRAVADERRPDRRRPGLPARALKARRLQSCRSARGRCGSSSPSRRRTSASRFTRCGSRMPAAASPSIVRRR